MKSSGLQCSIVLSKEQTRSCRRFQDATSSTQREQHEQREQREQHEQRAAGNGRGAATDIKPVL